jgi:NADPH:quinone reductase-like Zn-dependent oxidoreductase
VIDYTHQDFTHDQETYDVILDAVDKLDPSRGKRRLKPTGVYLNIVKHSGAAGGVTTEDLGFLTRLAEEGRIRAVVDRRYPLEQIVEAHRYVEQGHKKGHVVITVAAAGDATT